MTEVVAAAVAADPAVTCAKPDVCSLVRNTSRGYNATVDAMPLMLPAMIEWRTSKSLFLLVVVVVDDDW